MLEAQADISKYIQGISKLPVKEQKELLDKLKALEQARTREAARGSFLRFVREMWPAFIEGAHHRIMADAFERVLRGELKRLIINMPPRHRLNIDTPVLTVSGWKTIETIMAGDMVFSPSGVPVKVVGKSPVSKEKIYEVETVDGHIIECDGDHLWSLSFLTRGHPSFGFREYSTKQAFEKGKPSGGGPYIPDWLAVEFPEADLPIHPYVLGVWLGDGAKYGATVGCSFSDEREMRSLIEECGYKTSDRNSYQMFGVLGLYNKLKKYDLLENKHIPEIYFTGSIDQRESLLQGLIDTDGCVDKSGRVTFHQTDQELTKQVCSLINSLGAKARITKRQTNYKNNLSKPSYRINFRHPRAARLSRKRERLGDSGIYPGRSITIRETDRYDYVQCIKVDNDDGLFLAGRGFIVTHNTKSEFASYLLPAWFLGNFPEKKIIQTSHTAELAVGFGRKVRNLVGSEGFQKIFPSVGLRTDSKAAGRWNTSKDGEYFAIGVGGSVTGRGADLFVVDDPHDEQEATQAATQPEIFDKVYEWYTSGPRQRLQPGGAIVIVMTRWSVRDLTGQVLKSSIQRDGVDEWEVIQFPAIMPDETPLWPEFWSMGELEKLRSELPVSKWSAQYQQDPTSEEGALIKRDWWQTWDHERPPKCDAVIISWDTAFLKTERADYSACTTWGVFSREGPTGEPVNNVILLDAFKKRMEFPELKKEVHRHYFEWEPDMIIVEAKAAGAPLVYELRAMGIPVSEYTPSRGNDKVSRVNAVSDMFASGMIWAPTYKRWAEEVIEECASFPFGENDDLVDSTTQALLRIRQGGFIRTTLDEEDEDKSFWEWRRRNRAYY